MQKQLRIWEIFQHLPEDKGKQNVYVKVVGPRTSRTHSDC